MTKTEGFRSGFVALVGRPNAGKSTLMNAVLEERLAIVSEMPQTTQRNMKGIYNADNIQIVFVDTPGIHEGKHKLNEAMYKQSTDMFSDQGLDCLVYMVDIYRELGAEEDLIAQMVGQTKVPVLIVFNKVDICEDRDKALAAFSERYPFLRDKPSVFLSALSENGEGEFIKAIDPFIQEGPAFFDPDELTDQSLRFFASEYIRRQIIQHTTQEIPHASCVEIVEYKELGDRHEILADIHVERQGQKAIIIGKNAVMLKKIQKNSAYNMRKLVGMPVKIKCFVKVTPKWRDNQNFLREIGISNDF